MRGGKNHKKIAVWDTETDPFCHGRKLQVFCCGYYDGEQYIDFWGDDCLVKFLDFLSTEPPTIIYAHNGGKFDFHFLAEIGAIENPITMVDGRILKAALMQHELRDSYAAIPIPLGAYKKDEFDYAMMEADVRHKNKAEILAYLRNDCVYLYELVEKFIERFGLKLTIGSAALTQLKKLHPFGKLHEDSDEKVRPYYCGGRVQPFVRGKNTGGWKIYDVNSMYPYVMSKFRHPIGATYMSAKPDRATVTRLLSKNIPFFIAFSGMSKGALPVRTKAGLSFPDGDGEFLCTSHELAVGLEHGLITIDCIDQVVMSAESGSFGEFVGKFSEEKIAAKKSGDKAQEFFAKLILNSAYGKTGQNPRNFYEWSIYHYEGERPKKKDGWRLYEECPLYEIWRRPAPSDVYHNVGIAASITGAARAVLLSGLIHAERPAYCDTDSIICESLDMPLDDYRLGAWALEAEGDSLYIGGKKMYALYAGDDCIKRASKGVRLSGEEIIRVCGGEKIEWENTVPSFSIFRPQKYVKRLARMTI